MKYGKLEKMTKGWFVGNFEPSFYKTEEVEVAIKVFKKGENESAHYHKIATEITVITHGKVKMFNKEWGQGDIVIAEPGDVTSFLAIEDCTLTVVKLPGVLNDKYLAEE